MLFMQSTLFACASSISHVNEFLDPRTGVTVMSNDAPLILYRENPSRAAYARNYVHLGPIEVNQTGHFKYFIWVGVWNTMQTANNTRQRDGFESITVFADGEPLQLDVTGWTPEAIGTSYPAYPKPVASAADAYYQVTVDQIRLIAEAKDIRLRTGGSSPKEYHLWESQSAAQQSLTVFLESALF